jgi:hypothetical protein
MQWMPPGPAEQAYLRHYQQLLESGSAPDWEEAPVTTNDSGERGYLWVMVPTPHDAPFVLDVEYVKRVTVKAWPREVAFSCFFLETADPDVLTVDGDEVTLTVDNGRAVYALGPASTTAPIRRGTLISSRLSEGR